LFLDKKEEILIKTRRNIFGQNVGGNPSLFSGNGLDFKELREYDINDDVRKINWKVTAKAQRPFVNLFNEERELNIMVVFMVSGSIYFGTKRFKQELMAEILALISYSSLKSDDRLSTLLFSDKEKFFMPSTKKMGSLHVTLEEALKLNPLGEVSDFNTLVDFINQRVKKRSLLFIISDFYGDVDLSLLNKHEVFAVMVRDRFEESPKLFGQMQLLDANTLKSSDMSLSKGVLKGYKKELKAHDDALLEHFSQHRIATTKIYTDEDPFMKLSQMFRH